MNINLVIYEFQSRRRVRLSLPRFANEEMLKRLFYMVRKLLEHGAAVKRVSHDEANVTRIRQSCHIYFQQHKKTRNYLMKLNV